MEFDHFDMHAGELAESWRDTFSAMRDECPVVHSDQHGGFRALSRYHDVEDAARRDDVFSSRNDADSGSLFQGVLIPPNKHRTGMIEMDRDDWRDLRRLIGMYFTPSAVGARSDRAADVVTWAIDNVIEDGEIDFVNDLGSLVPAVVLFEMLGMSLANWRTYADAFHKFIYVQRPSAELEAIERDVDDLMATLAAVVDERREDPRDDVISCLATARIAGEPLTKEQIIEQMFSLLAAGLDTTTNLFAHSVVHLAKHPDVREHLIRVPEDRPAATEEFLRYYSPLQGIARTTSTACEVGGQKLGEGERVWLLYASANQDESVFAEPAKFIADRSPNPHLAFGIGIHKCIGQHLARMEFRAMLDGVLDRMPDFSVTESGVQPYPSVAFVNGYITIPATFTPGVRAGGTGLVSMA